MGKALLALMLLVNIVFAGGYNKKITVFLAGDSTMSIKEQKAWPETGWGMPFATFWNEDVAVVNKAKNGRSTRTFFSEGLWKSITSEAGEGDYVFIQFGHNDESKEKEERYTNEAQVEANLLQMVKETRALGATPVLITPVSRRRFDSLGNALPTHTTHSPVVRKVASQTSTMLIDLDSTSTALYQQLGAEASKLLFLHLQPNQHPNYPQGKTDNTHFNELGARRIAEQVLAAIRASALPLKDHMIKR